MMDKFYIVSVHYTPQLGFTFNNAIVVQPKIFNDHILTTFKNNGLTISLNFSVNQNLNCNYYSCLSKPDHTYDYIGFTDKDNAIAELNKWLNTILELNKWFKISNYLTDRIRYAIKMFEAA